MILETLGIFKIFEWMTGSGQQRQLATPPQPYRSDKVVETIDVPGGEMRMVVRWYRGVEKQYYVEGRLIGNRKWTPIWWHCGWSCIPDDVMSDVEVHKEFRKMFEDPDVLRPLKEKQ
jgi:hypothetical protein